MAVPLSKLTARCYRPGGATVLRNSSVATTNAASANAICHHARRRRHFHRLAAWNDCDGHHDAVPQPLARGGCAVFDSVEAAPNHRTSYRGHRYRFSTISNDAPPPSKSFKKVIRPFLMACHPDAMAAEETGERAAETKRRRHPLSRRAKAVNLEAVQTINGLIDVLDELIGRCTPPSYSARSLMGGHDESGSGSLPELKARYEIEFVLSTAIIDDGAVSKPKKKHREKEPLTLRSVVLSFPQQLRSDVKKWALTSFPSNTMEPHAREEEAYEAATQLRDHALLELLRLLSIAGMQAPASSVRDLKSQQQRPGQTHRKEETEWTLSDHFLHELGIDPNDESVTEDPTPSKPRGQSLAFFGRTRAQPSRTSPRPAKAPPPQYAHPHLQKQRQQFIQSIPWNEFAKDYDRAYRDAEADWTTSRMKLYDVGTPEGRERREEFVSRICGNVRIWRAGADAARDGVIEDDEIPEGLDVVAQLVAIRRLSLMLNDNFDHLKMEKMGRMWERLVIVLTPPRGRGRSDGGRTRKVDDVLARPTFDRQGRRRKLSKWERRLKRREKREPMSRGRMRHVAEVLLERKEERRSEDDEEEGGDEGEVQRSTMPESGFKFSYGTHSDQGAGHVTAHIPVDFREGELVRQLHAHVHDYFDACCGDVGLLRYGADGEVRAATGGGRGSSNEEGGGRNSRKMDVE